MRNPIQMRNFLFLLLFLFTVSLCSQSQIYSEDFTGQNGKGAIGPAPTTDLSGVDWSIDISSATLSANSDWFKVVNEVFEARDIDGDAIWYSPSINISSYTGVSFSLSATESGTMEATDIFETHYRVDGGSWTSASTNGSLNDDFGSGVTVSQSSLSGNTLEIKVTMNNGAGAEYHRLDDIVVSGTASGGSVDPEPTNHPSGLSASATHEKITLTWTDAATGSQAPSKYLIIGETDSSIDNPADDTAIADDSDASDNRITINVNHGVQTTSFSNVGNKTWYFEIFPYTNSGSDIDFKTDGTIETANVTTSAIQITEIVYNTPSTDWEWVELYNPTGSAIDISGYTIIDNHPNTMVTFPGSTSISATSYFTAVVNGGGIAQFSADYDPGAGNYVGGLNNGSDSVILKDASSNIVDQVDYDSGSPWPTDPNNSFKSLELIDGNNNYYAASWQASSAEYGSPGAKSSTAWNNSLGSGDDLTISSPDNIVITGDKEINNITINSGATLTVEKSGSLTVAGDFTNNGAVKLQSDSNEFAAIKVGGTPTGNITYKRYVNIVGTDAWDLVGSPVGGNNYISSFITANSGRLATNGSSPTAYAVGYYDNSADSWTNYNSSSVVNNSTAFDLGKGYQMAHVAISSSGGVLDFTGTIPSGSVSKSVINNSASGRRWNLVANPYPSHLNANTSAHTNNFLSENSSVIDSSYLAIYGYDADGSGYTIYNQASGATYIAPGQGFMVAASSSSLANILFTEAMQTIVGGDDFISDDIMENIEVVIKIFNGDDELDSTKLFFDEGLTLGLDPGYDAGHFDDNAPLMTRLTEDDEGHGMAINAMGFDAMENAVIPLVINQTAGQEFRINLHTATIPGPNIYLEDVEEGVFINLYEEDFVLTPTSDLSEAGRFFIHMTADTMSNGEVSTSMLNAYKEINASHITLEGLATQSNNINVSLYNILGRKVLDTSLNNNVNTQTISTLGMASGIYVIELESGNDRLTKKLIIQ